MAQPSARTTIESSRSLRTNSAAARKNTSPRTIFESSKTPFILGSERITERQEYPKNRSIKLRLAGQYHRDTPGRGNRNELISTLIANTSTNEISRPRVVPRYQK
jgi:hypothetical protein